MSGAQVPDRRWLLAAIELSRSCPAVTTAYAIWSAGSTPT